MRPFRDHGPADRPRVVTNTRADRVSKGFEWGLQRVLIGFLKGVDGVFEWF